MVAEDDFPGQGSLAVTKEDSSQARHNVSISWRDLFVLNKQNESKGELSNIFILDLTDLNSLFFSNDLSHSPDLNLHCSSSQSVQLIHKSLGKMMLVRGCL